MLKIKRTSNGFIVTESLGGDIEVEVIQETSDIDDKESITTLLFRVAEFAGYIPDRYGKTNLSIKWNALGSKVQDD